MPTNPESSGARGPPRKRTLSTKVTTNGDPNVERKRKKLQEEQQNGATTALTKKKPTNTTTKAAPAVAKQTAAPASAKPAPEYLKLYADDSDNSDDMIQVDNSIASEPITIEDSDDDMDIEDVPEAPEESAEAELSM